MAWAPSGPSMSRTSRASRVRSPMLASGHRFHHFSTWAGSAVASLRPWATLGCLAGLGQAAWPQEQEPSWPAVWRGRTGQPRWAYSSAHSARSVGWSAIGRRTGDAAQVEFGVDSANAEPAELVEGRGD